MTAEHKPLSPGERAVWAAEFVRALSDGVTPRDAADCAASTVEHLRSVHADVERGEPMVDAERAMLEDMLGHPGELICPDGRTAAFTAVPDACVLCGRPADYHRSRR